MKPGQDFDFGSVKEFGFSGSAQGRHDPLNQKPMDDNEFGGGSFPEPGFAKGGMHRGAPHGTAPGGPKVPLSVAAGAVKGAAMLGTRIGAKAGARIAPAINGGPGALSSLANIPGVAPAMGAMGGGASPPPAGKPSAMPPAMKRGGRVRRFADGGDVNADEMPGAPMDEPPMMARGGSVPAMNFGGGDPAYDSDADEAMGAAGAQYQPGTQTGYAKGGRNFIAGAIKHPGGLRRDLGVQEGQTIPAGKLAAAAKGSGKVAQRARFAETLRAMPHKGKKG